VNCSRFPIGTTDASWRLRQLGALALRCGEKSSHQKTGLDVGMVKSAVADPADVLAGYVSKMWSQARNYLALDGLGLGQRAVVVVDKATTRKLSRQSGLAEHATQSAQRAPPIRNSLLAKLRPFLGAAILAIDGKFTLIGGSHEANPLRCSDCSVGDRPGNGARNVRKQSG
jgi:hypothetical protein